MKWNRSESYLVTLCLVSLLILPVNVDAVPISDAVPTSNAGPKSKAKQGFGTKKPGQGTTKKTFFDFLKMKDPAKSDPVEFKGKKKFDDKQNKIPPVKLKLSDVFLSDPQDPKSAQQVQYELVALSLTSVNQVPLDDIFDQPGLGDGSLTLTLIDKGPKKVKTEEFSKDTGKGKLKLKVKKDFKVKAKKQDGRSKKKKLSEKKSDKKFKTGLLNFESGSPIRITDDFCLDNGQVASICLTPISYSVIPLPGAFVLMASALSLLVSGQYFRRRRLNRAG